METLGLILLKSAAWLTGFALVYLLMLRNERFFRLNRIYLFGGIVASLLFPFYTFHYAVILPPVTTNVASAEDLLPGTVVPSGSSALTIAFWIYLLGITAFLLRLLFQTWKIILKLRKSGYENAGAVKLVRTPEFVNSFSFFSFVFVNPSIATVEMEEILNHEREHIQQRHWFDLLFVELVLIVQWFNPFAWIYAHLVRQNHEFLADESALQTTSDPAIYQAALLNQLLGVPVFSLTNSFSYSLNKKRFKMMKKKIDSPFRKFKMLAVLPLVATLFYAFAVPEYRFPSDNAPLAQDAKTIDVKGQVLKSDGTPLSGTSVILKNSTTGTITDKDGNFMLKGMPIDGELFFSFVGFKTQVQKVSGKPMKITMETSTVGIDKVTVVGYGTPPKLPPPPPPSPSVKEMLNGVDKTNPPLIRLDGVDIDRSEMEKIDPNTIHSVGVLKDKNATDLFGEKAKNGVILIMTKAKVAADRAKRGDNSTPKAVERISDPDVFVVVEEMPEFPGGEIALRNFIAENIKYPAEAKEKGIQGKVFVAFVVTSDGKTERARIARGVDPSLDGEALRVIGLLPDWKPGKQHGVNVNVSYTVPINFALGDKKEAPVTQENNTANVEKQVFVVVEEMPEFPGGSEALRKFIAATVRYPAEAQKEKAQGKVFVTFVVNDKGKVEKAKVVRSIHPALDAEALRVINQSPDWKPGRQRGVPVSVSYTMPIEFKLK